MQGAPSTCSACTPTAEHVSSPAELSNSGRCWVFEAHSSRASDNLEVVTVHSSGSNPVCPARKMSLMCVARSYLARAESRSIPAKLNGLHRLARGLRRDRLGLQLYNRRLTEVEKWSAHRRPRARTVPIPCTRLRHTDMLLSFRHGMLPCSLVTPKHPSLVLRAQVSGFLADLLFNWGL